MTAIQPARLKRQVIELGEKYSQPAVFVRQLHALLDMYSNHTHRRGQSGEPLPLVGSYNAPAPVMNQVWHELQRLAQAQPQAMWPLCDALWAEQNYDLQLLAGRIVGQLPVTPPDPVITRLQAWVQDNPDKRLLDGLFEHGLARLVQEAPEQLMELVAGWLTSRELAIQHAGLRALLPIIKSAGPSSLPTIFHLMTPYLRIAPTRLRPDIVSVVAALAHCSPAEVAFLLRQNLSAPDNPDTPWLIRQVQDEFPEEMRTGLREAMKAAAP
jgi:hypothetical protein